MGTPYIQGKSQKLFYHYGKADWVHLRSLLSYIHWDCAFLDHNINKNRVCWKDLFFYPFHRCIPKRRGKKETQCPLDYLGTDWFVQEKEMSVREPPSGKSINNQKTLSWDSVTKLSAPKN